MELYKALKNIIQTEGPEIVKDLRLINILNDFNAYNDIPASKYILRAIIADGYSSKLLSMNIWDNQTEGLIHKFITTTGFVPNSAYLIFQSIAYGLGIINSVSNNMPSKSQTSVSSCSSSTIDASEYMLTSAQLNKKPNDFVNDYAERAADYLDSILEFKDDFKKYGLKIKVNSSYRVYSNPTSTIEWNIEIEGDIKCDKNDFITHCFDIVLYNQKGKIIERKGVYTYKSIKDFGVLTTESVDEQVFKSVGNIGKIYLLAGEKLR